MGHAFQAPTENYYVSGPLRFGETVSSRGTGRHRHDTHQDASRCELMAPALGVQIKQLNPHGAYFKEPRSYTFTCVSCPKGEAIVDVADVQQTRGPPLAWINLPNSPYRRRFAL